MDTKTKKFYKWLMSDKAAVEYWKSEASSINRVDVSHDGQTEILADELKKQYMAAQEEMMADLKSVDWYEVAAKFVDRNFESR